LDSDAEVFSGHDGVVGLGFAGDDGRLEFVASHPFARKKAKGWGTELLFHGWKLKAKCQGLEVRRGKLEAES
jgi:hypothetical protein